MKKIKKIATSVLAVFSSMLCAYAYNVDYGGELTTGLEASSPWEHYKNLIVTEDLTGWLFVPISIEKEASVTAQATVQGVMRNVVGYKPDFDFNANLDLLNFHYNSYDGGSSYWTFNGGRFNFTDTTGLICNQTSDGAQFSYYSNKVNVSLYAGYTGLLNRQYTLMINSEGANYWQQCLEKEEDNRFYKYLNPWADPYLISSLKASFPYLFANQTLSLEASMYLGINGPSDFSTNNYNRYYFTTGLSGPLFLNGLNYNLTTTLFTTKFNGMGNMTQGNISWFAGWKDIVFSLTGVYASGEDDGISESLDTFVGFTSKSISYARYTTEHSAHTKGGFSFSAKPVKTFFVRFGMDRVFANNKGSFKYEGWQWYANCELQCTTDFKLSISEFRFFASEESKSSGGAIIKAHISF